MRGGNLAGKIYGTGKLWSWSDSVTVFADKQTFVSAEVLVCARVKVELCEPVGV